jgi:hypothetical protein
MKWFKKGQNLKNFVGASRTKVGDTRTKTFWFEQLADHVNICTDNRYSLDSKSMRARWENRIRKFKEAVNWPDKTGNGLTEAHTAQGIKSLADLFEKMCPFFDEMCDMFGEKANIIPPCEFDSTSFSGIV